MNSLPAIQQKIVLNPHCDNKAGVIETIWDSLAVVGGCYKNVTNGAQVLYSRHKRFLQQPNTKSFYSIVCLHPFSLYNFGKVVQGDTTMYYLLQLYRTQKRLEYEQKALLLLIKFAIVAHARYIGYKLNNNQMKRYRKS